MLSVIPLWICSPFPKSARCCFNREWLLTYSLFLLFLSVTFQIPDYRNAVIVAKSPASAKRYSLAVFNKNTFYSCSISVSVMNLHCLALTSLTILEKSKTASLCPTEGCRSLKGSHFIQLPFCAERCYALLCFFWCSTSLLYDQQQYLKFGVTVCVCAGLSHLLSGCVWV